MAQRLAANTARRKDDLLEDAIENWLNDNRDLDGFTLEALARGIGKIAPDIQAAPLDRATQMQISGVLALLGYGKKREGPRGQTKTMWRLG